MKCNQIQYQNCTGKSTVRGLFTNIIGLVSHTRVKRMQKKGTTNIPQHVGGGTIIRFPLKAVQRCLDTLVLYSAKHQVSYLSEIPPKFLQLDHSKWQSYPPNRQIFVNKKNQRHFRCPMTTAGLPQSFCPAAPGPATSATSSRRVRSNVPLPRRRAEVKSAQGGTGEMFFPFKRLI